MFIWVMKDVDIFLLRSSTLLQVITEVVYIGILRQATITLVISEDIIVVMLVYMYLGHKIPYTHTIVIG